MSPLYITTAIALLLALGAAWLASRASRRITQAEREDIYDADPWGDCPMPPWSGDISMPMGGEG